MAFWKNKQFKDLQKAWYERLFEFGFTDIEKNENLMQYSENSYRQANELERSSKLKYYTLLDQHIREKAPEFDCSIDYYVMHKFARGLTNKQICELLEGMDKPRHRKTLMYIRRKYENRWEIRVWKPEQLKSAQRKKPSA